MIVLLILAPSEKRLRDAISKVKTVDFICAIDLYQNFHLPIQSDRNIGSHTDENRNGGSSRSHRENKHVKITDDSMFE